jgi:hypothetical protein
MSALMGKSEVGLGQIDFRFDPGCVKTLLRCYDSLDDSRETVDEALH